MRYTRLIAALAFAVACQSCGGADSGGTGGKGGSGTGGGSPAGASGGGTPGTGGGAGTSAGRGGSSAGSGGSGATAGRGGGAGGGGSAGAAGSGAGGSAGTGGSAAGAGGNTAGTGGSTAGAGGSVAGAGGSSAGAGGRGGAAGAAGGRGGATAGSGGAAGTGGTAGGGRGGAGGSGGTSSTDAGSDATSAFNPCPAAGTACIIMPLGDSITYGVGSSTSGSYRVPLFQTTVTANQSITFKGRNMTGPTMVAGQTFPRGNEGYSGYTIDDDPVDSRSGISPLVDPAISMFHPHIVLLMIGTNDVNLNYMLSAAPTRLGNLLDKITTDAPDALVVLARLTPTQDDTVNGRAQTYNNAMPGLVQTRVAAGKHIVLVDMYAAFTANANYKTMLMNDTLHPNDAGYMVMAQTWYAAIRDYLR